MDAELAKEMARSGGLGLSAILQDQLGRIERRPSGAGRKR
jgi:Rod binding domain-containing protein